jgi:phage terminase Nu1 subunit (DNA packaging protein)
MDLSAPVSQREFGELVGLSQPAVSDLVRRGVLGEGETAGEWLLAYCDQLREVAAGRGGEEGINLVKERALLAREQRIAKAMQNAERRGELAPVAVLEQVLANTGAKVGKILATIKGEIRRRFPQLTSADLVAVDSIVGKAMAQAASLSLQALQSEEGAGIDDDPEPEPIEAEAA